MFSILCIIIYILLIHRLNHTVDSPSWQVCFSWQVDSVFPCFVLFVWIFFICLPTLHLFIKNDTNIEKSWPSLWGFLPFDGNTLTLWHCGIFFQAFKFLFIKLFIVSVNFLVHRLIQDISNLAFLRYCCCLLVSKQDHPSCALLFSHVWFFMTPWTVAHHARLSMKFSRQEYWSGLPFPPSGNLLNPGIEPTSLVSPALAGRFFTIEPPGKPSIYFSMKYFYWFVFPVSVQLSVWFYFGLSGALTHFLTFLFGR